jgi:hypothetical protein
VKRNRDFVLAYGDGFDYGFHHLPAFSERKLRPVVGQAAGLRDHVVAGQQVQAAGVHVCGKLRDLCIKLGGAGFQRPVPLLELLGRDVVTDVEIVRLVHGLLKPGAFGLKRFQKGRFLRHLGIGLFNVPSQPFGRE